MNTKQPPQPIWVKVEAYMDNGHAKFTVERFPITNLSKNQKLKIAEKKKLVNERVRTMRAHGTGFSVSESFAL